MVRPERRNAEIFGANVRRRREALGLSQRNFSVQLGIAQATLSVVETGAVNLTLRSMTKLAEAAGINLRTMLEP